MNGYFKFTGKDVLQGAINAIVAAVVVGLYGLVTKEGFDLFNTDWAALLKSVINWAFAAFIGSLGKEMLTNKDGAVLGIAKTAQK